MFFSLIILLLVRYGILIICIIAIWYGERKRKQANIRKVRESIQDTKRVHPLQHKAEEANITESEAGQADTTAATAAEAPGHLPIYLKSMELKSLDSVT